MPGAEAREALEEAQPEADDVETRAVPEPDGRPVACRESLLAVLAEIPRLAEEVAAERATETAQAAELAQTLAPVAVVATLSRLTPLAPPPSEPSVPDPDAPVWAADAVPSRRSRGERRWRPPAPDDSVATEDGATDGDVAVDERFQEMLSAVVPDPPPQERPWPAYLPPMAPAPEPEPAPAAAAPAARRRWRGRRAG